MYIHSLILIELFKKGGGKVHWLEAAVEEEERGDSVLCGPKGETACVCHVGKYLCV